MFMVRGAQWYWPPESWKEVKVLGWLGSLAHTVAGKLWSVYQNRTCWPATRTPPLMNLNPTNMTGDWLLWRTRCPLAVSRRGRVVGGGLWSMMTPPGVWATRTSQPFNGRVVAAWAAVTVPAEYVPL